MIWRCKVPGHQEPRDWINWPSYSGIFDILVCTKRINSAELFWREKICLCCLFHQYWYRKLKTLKKIENLAIFIQSISLMLMSWWHNESGHQQTWSWSNLSKTFCCQHHIEGWTNMPATSCNEVMVWQWIMDSRQLLGKASPELFSNISVKCLKVDSI